jgi:hypothetical protein
MNFVHNLVYSSLLRPENQYVINVSNLEGLSRIFESLVLSNFVYEPRLS